MTATLLRVHSVVLVGVPLDYYSHTLSQRAIMLQAREEHLCKTIVLENRAAAEAGVDGAPRFVMVVLQYVAKLDLVALAKALRHAVTPPLPKSAIRLCVGDEVECTTMTGFIRNAICPFGSLATLPVRPWFPPRLHRLVRLVRNHHCPGMVCGCNSQVVVSSAASKVWPPVLWLGGGQVDVKLRVPIPQLIAKLHASVVDCTTLREAADSTDDEL